MDSSGNLLLTRSCLASLATSNSLHSNKVRKTNAHHLLRLTRLPSALKETVDWFVKNYHNARIGDVKT
jgi:N-acetylmuramoyl-L-alanine amidase